MRVLAIETSCDETAAAVVDGETEGPLQIVSNVIHTQAKVHAQFGGVVPEVASREHVNRLGGIVRQAMVECAPQSIDAVAVTRGPGLMGCLLVGIQVAKGLAMALEKPLIGVKSTSKAICRRVCWATMRSLIRTSRWWSAVGIPSSTRCSVFGD